MSRVFVIFMALTVLVFGQEQQEQRVIEIRQFKGLNTRASDFDVQPNEARDVFNVDLSRGGIGSIQKRLGYDSVSSIAGMDSMLAIYGAYYSDGTQQLVFTTDSDGTGYGGIYVTNKGSANIEADSSTRVWQYFSTQNRPSFTMLNDDVYIANGSQKAVRWNGKQARPYPHPAPGEPLLVPISDGDELNGEYRYMFVSPWIDTIGTDITYLLAGYPTSTVKVNSGRMLATWFQWQRNDWMHPDNSQDSVHVLAYRTKANPVGLQDEIYVFRVDSTDTLSLLVADVDTIGNLVWIDSIADSDLSATDSLLLYDPLIYNGRYFSDGMRRYGGPGVDSTDTLSGGDVGIYTGVDTLPIPGGISDAAGWEWRCTFTDSATGQESNLSPPLDIETIAAAGNQFTIEQVTIVLPVPPTTAPELVVNLYRAKILTASYDSLFLNFPPGGLVELAPYWIYFRDSIAVSEVFYLVEQIAVSDTLFVDSVSWTTLKSHATFHGESVPPLFRDIQSFDGRVFGSQRSNLYFSKQLDNWFFEVFDFVPLNISDGDEITLFFPSRGVIRVFKNNSNFNVYEDSDFEWKRREISGYFGVIAPKSWAPGLMGHYYLSENGVIRETEGLTLERTQTIELVSAQLDNFDKLPISTKAKGVGFYFDQKYLLSYPALDTTYVYDERAQSWTTWDLSFSSATLYGVESSFGFFPGDTMYFISGGGLSFNNNVLYRYGSSEYDDGEVILMFWESGPLMVTPQYKLVTGIGMWRQSSDDSDALNCVIRNESRTTLLAAKFDSLTDRYSTVSTHSGYNLYYTFQISSVGFEDSLPTTIVDGIDIYYIESSPVETD